MRSRYLIGSLLFIFLMFVLISSYVENNNNNKIMGYATQATNEISTEFPIDGWEYTGWGKCTGQQGSWSQVDAYCKYKGYSGALPIEEKPCYHEWSSSRWGWDGGSPMQKSTYTGGGYAFTKIKCYTNEQAQSCNPACPSGYTCESDSVCRKDGKTCTETGDSGKDYNTKGTVIDTQTTWVGSSWADSCDGNTLVEFYCSNDNVALSNYACINGCENGACKSTPSTPSQDLEPACTDPDDPTNIDHPYKYRTKTTVTSTVNGQKTDQCIDTKYIQEYYCDETTKEIKSETYNCENEGYKGSCNQGACKVELDVDEDTSDQTHNEQESQPLDVDEIDDLDPDPISNSEEQEIEDQGIQLIIVCNDPDGSMGYNRKTTVTVSSGSPSRTDTCASDFTGECPGCVWKPNQWFCDTSIDTSVFSKYDCKQAKKGEYLVEYYCDYTTNEIQPYYYDCSSEGKTCKDGACIQEPEWHDIRCTGTPTPCNEYSISECRNHYACSVWNYWSISWCAGPAIGCNSYNDENLCRANGCQWT